MLKMAEMPYHVGLVVKIYPSDQQKRLIAVNDGAKRAVYNHLVACGNEVYKLSKSAASVPAYRKRIAYLKSASGSTAAVKNALPFLYDDNVDSYTVLNAIKNYSAAWKNMKTLHRGVPQFKKKSYQQSYQTNATYHTYGGELHCSVYFEDCHHVTLPKLGGICFDGSPKKVEQLLTNTNTIRIGTVTISRDAVGEYWASFALASENKFADDLPKTGSMEGIDLNLINLVDASDGSSCENKHFYRASEQKLIKAQKKLSRMQEHAKKGGRDLRDSKNYQKQRQKVAYIHRKVARQRADYLNVISKREVENQDLIAAEDLKVRNLLKNHRLAKSIADAGWRTLLTQLQYKSQMYGKTTVLVPPEYTTQTCSYCGHVLKGDQKLSLSEREWTCPSCGKYHHRDTNSAEVILQRGLKIVSDAASVA